MHFFYDFLHALFLDRKLYDDALKELKRNKLGEVTEDIISVQGVEKKLTEKAKHGEPKENVNSKTKLKRKKNLRKWRRFFYSNSEKQRESKSSKHICSIKI